MCDTFFGAEMSGDRQHFLPLDSCNLTLAFLDWHQILGFSMEHSALHPWQRTICLAWHGSWHFISGVNIPDYWIIGRYITQSQVRTSWASRETENPSEGRTSWSSANGDLKFGGTNRDTKNASKNKTSTWKKCDVFIFRRGLDEIKHSKTPTFQHKIVLKTSFPITAKVGEDSTEDPTSTRRPISDISYIAKSATLDKTSPKHDFHA